MTVGILVILSSFLLILLLQLALAANESLLGVVNLPTDFIRLLRDLVDGVPAKLVEKPLVEESQLARKVLVPLLFVCFSFLSVDRAAVLVRPAMLI